MELMPEELSDVEDVDEIVLDERTRIAMEQVFNNPLLLRKIFQRSDYPSLMNSRLVNRCWNFVTSEILIPRDRSVIYMVHHDKSTGYCQSTWAMTLCSGIPIDDREIFKIRNEMFELNRLLSNSTNFPCTHFAFRNIRLDDVEIQNFFRIQKESIKTLHLELETLPSRSCSHQLPSESCIHQLPKISRPSPPVPLEPFIFSLDKFQNLKELRLRHVRLSHPTDTPITPLPQLQSLSVDDESIHTIRNIDISHLLHLELEIKAVPIRYTYDRLYETIEKMLEQNRNSLTSLSWRISEGHFIGLQIPLLPNLQVLQLGYADNRTDLMSPLFFEGFNLKSIYPNLRHLKCPGFGSHSHIDGSWTKFFGHFQGTLDSVESIDIVGRCTKNWMAFLKSFCPNLKHIRLVSIIDLFHTLVKLCHVFPRLESLELCFADMDTELHLDQIFTGFLKDICDDLRNGIQFSDEELAKKRSRWSLVNFQNLKNLNLYFDSKTQQALTYLDRPHGFFSVVPCHYAFKMMNPELKVKLFYDHSRPYSKLLTEKCADVAELVTICHSPAHRYPFY